MEPVAADCCTKKSIQASRSLKAQAKLARELGVSRKRLSGWEPAEVTTFEYDDSGRVVRQITVREAEWDRDEEEFLVASRELEADTGPHGFLMSEAMDPANQFAFEGDPVPAIDFAEKARLDKQDAYYKKWDTKDNPVNRNGHIFNVKKKP